MYPRLFKTLLNVKLGVPDLFDSKILPDLLIKEHDVGPIIRIAHPDNKSLDDPDVDSGVSEGKDLSCSSLIIIAFIETTLVTSIAG